MSGGALWFEELVVRRMPGVADGGFRLEALSPGINVVHGPNASGKTTTARAIQALLWPRSAAPENASVAGRFRLGGGVWSAELDAGRVRYQRDGADASAPALPPAEARDRYRLALHELLASQDRGLAAEIVRESAGGYDLAGAAEAVGARDGASRRSAEANALKAARAALREAEAKQASLRAEEAELDDLRRRAAAAAEAGRRARLVEYALDHAVAVEAEAAARRALEVFPEAMARLRGDEADRLAALRRKLDDARARAAAAVRDLEAADAARGEAGLPDEGVPHQAITALRGRIERLDELRRAIETHERALAEAAARRAEEERTLGGSPSHAIDASALDDLAGFARDAGEVHALWRAAEAEVRWLAGTNGADGADAASAGAAAPAVASADAGDAGTAGAMTRASAAVAANDTLADTLSEAAALLRRWLRAGGEALRRERRLRALGAAAAALLLAASMAAAWLLVRTNAGLPGEAASATPSAPSTLPAAIAAAIHAAPRALALALTAFVLLLLILRRGGPDARAVHRAEFERLDLSRTGVAGPAEWTDDDVARTLGRLELALAEARLAAERARRRAEAEQRRAALRQKLDAIAKRGAALAGRLGLDPEQDPARLFWLAQRIARWQDAARAEAAATAALAAARSQFDRALREARERVAPFGYADVDDVAGLHAAIEDLDRRREAHRQAADAAAQARRRLDEVTAEAAGLEAERLALLERLGLGPADDAIVRDLCDRVEAYREARERCTDAERRREDARRRLAEAPGYTPELESQSVAALKDALDAAVREAAEAEALQKRLTQIETRIEEAKRSHDVEAALAEVVRCEDALREARERDAHAVVAGTLVRFLQRATRDQHRPAVFHRARQLFARITHGRYRLDFDDGDPPAFRAFDTTTGTGHALDELSSGTRVQLLLAVRIAFVESQEAGARLPLIFDETLGNSDDERALAIMETALALAADGRQVFYFTAQPDEVGKWRGVLEKRPDVPSAFIDLARVRRLARRAASPLPVVAPPAATIPAPGDASHAEYGRMLDVPAIDVHAEPGGAHVWYLVDDPKALHRLLSLRVETWGALRSLVEDGGLELLGDEGDAFARAAAAARALEAALAAARIGRGRPVDRAALVASGAISERFLDTVDGLCQACGGDAKLLIEALEAGRVPRFRAQARDALREYLEAHDYLDPREPLDAAQVRARTLAAVATEIERGLVGVAHVDRLVAACVGTGGGAPVPRRPGAEGARGESPAGASGARAGTGA